MSVPPLTPELAEGAPSYPRPMKEHKVKTCEIAASYMASRSTGEETPVGEQGESQCRLCHTFRQGQNHQERSDTVPRWFPHNTSLVDFLEDHF